MLTIDGAHGEGGGQILRTAATLAALGGRSVRIVDVRAGRARPGLAAQHLTAVRAAAAICAGRLQGDALGSQELVLEPGGSVRAGDYAFDVGAAREGGSAGSTSLVLQTVLLPLALADGESTVVVRGGTHVASSPSFDYLAHVWAPALARLGVRIELELVRSGWFPIGRGEVRARVRGRSRVEPLVLREPGPLERVHGRALAAGLPEHVAERMANTARAELERAGAGCEIRAECVEAACRGAGLFLAADLEHGAAGFTALGARGKPAETVAAEGVREVLAFLRSGAAVDRHLADQLVLPLALAPGRSELTVEAVTRHLATSAWVVERFGLAEVSVEGTDGEPGRLAVHGEDGA